MVIELALIAAFTSVRSYSSPRVYSAPRTSVRTTTQSTRTSTRTSTPKSTTPKAPGRSVTPFKNSSGQTVAYRDTGMNFFTTWFLFGWLWHNDNSDKCYDANHKQIDCKK